MDTVLNSFSEVNAALSQSIYQDFNSGGVINKKEYLESQANFKESAKYRDIIVNQSHYQQLYFHLGFLLTHDEQGEYFYLKNANNEEMEETFDETSLKLMAILTILARLADKRGQSYLTLGEPVQGIVQADLDALNEDNEALSFLKTLKIKDASDAILWLKKRGFAFRVNKTRSILSKGALNLIDTIIERQKLLNSEEAFE
ncbi:MAG: hypothetical protein ACI9JN_002811 [Bacteroidia bacterium]|jgi:hypothetical protein